MMKQCEEIIVMGTHERCPNKFNVVKNSSKGNFADNSLCPHHRYCYHPLANGTRCTNLRKPMKIGFLIYCPFHMTDPECLRLMHEYKKMCVSTERCYRASFSYISKLSLPEQINVYEKFSNVFNNLNKCLEARGKHHSLCIHREVLDKGHTNMLIDLEKSVKKCVKVLKSIKPYNNPLKEKTKYIYDKL